jgi:hypothetical protein
MKKLISLTFAAVCFLGFTSCEGEEENEFVQKNYVAGTWEVSEVGALNSGNVLNYVPVTVAEGCNVDKIVLNEDKTFVNTDYSVNEGNCTNVQISGTYDLVAGNVILSATVNEAAFSRTYDLLALTKDLMEVVYTDPETNKLAFIKFTRTAE